MRKPRLVFFGNERLATGVKTTAPLLRALVGAGYEIPLVVANFTPGLSRSNRRLEIIEVAHAYHIPVVMPGSLAEIAERLEDYKADTAVLAAYGKIISRDMIDIFPRGIINLHPSLLPLYRGPTPIEAAILDGARQTGVSIMRLAAKMDAGPVFAQVKLKLRGDESKQQLASQLANPGVKLMLKCLPGILDESLKPLPQNDQAATYSRLIKKEDGILDWSKPAEVLEREVRAYAGWPRSVTRVFGQKIIVTKTRLAKNEHDGKLVMKARPGYLEILELVGPSGRTMSGADFVRGYKR